jgi:hypothetical protein
VSRPADTVAGAKCVRSCHLCRRIVKVDQVLSCRERSRPRDA